MPFNFPILLTWTRVLVIPLIIAIYYIPTRDPNLALRNNLACSIFIIAAITDWLDGFLARKWKQTSPFGAFLDPVADKLMVTATLLVLLDLGRIHAAMALIMIGREITISALREWMSQLGKPESTAVNYLGKLKTVMQMIALPMLLFFQPFAGVHFAQIGYWALNIAVCLTVLSMSYYLNLAWPNIKNL